MDELQEMQLTSLPHVYQPLLKYSRIGHWTDTLE
jgi:hypothetical protein